MNSQSLDLILSRLRRCRVWVGGNDLSGKEYVSLKGMRGDNFEEFDFAVSDLRALLASGKIKSEMSERLEVDDMRYIRPHTAHVVQRYWKVIDNEPA